MRRWNEKQNIRDKSEACLSHILKQNKRETQTSRAKMRQKQEVILQLCENPQDNQKQMAVQKQNI